MIPLGLQGAQIPLLQEIFPFWGRTEIRGRLGEVESGPLLEQAGQFKGHRLFHFLEWLVIRGNKEAVAFLKLSL